MAASGFTPISLYYSTTAAAVPTSGNLANGELGLNIADMKLYAKNSAGTVTLLASSGGAAGTVSSVAVSGGTTGLTTSGGPITTSGTITLAGTLATTNGGTNLTSFTSGGVVYASSTSALATGSALTFDGTYFGVGLANPSGFSSTIVSQRTTDGLTFTGARFDGTNNPRFEIGHDNNGTYLNTTSSAGGSSTQMRFNIASTEQMRLTSTGLGIGTSSPAQKLSVVSSAGTPASFTSTGTSVFLALANSGATTFIGNDSTSGSFVIQTPASSYSTKFSVSNAGVVSDSNGALRAVPQSGSSKTSSYTLATTDVGEYILLGASGAIVIPDATFAAGDVITIFNNTASTATITCSIMRFLVLYPLFFQMLVGMCFQLYLRNS